MTQAHDIATGKVCKRCGRYYPRGLNPEVTGPVLCCDCEALATNCDEETHSSWARCPNCRNTFDVYEKTEGEACTEGEHSIWCDECDHEFTIGTTVMFTYTSPPCIEKKP